MMRALYTLTTLLMLTCAPGARAQAEHTVLSVATERLTALALNYQYYPQFARLGFGTPAEPWHPWFGALDMRALIYLPDYEPGVELEISPGMLLGTAFRGQHWKSAFDALASLDADGNSIVEGDEMRDLYLWVDFNSSGTLAIREDALLSAHRMFAGFDLRTAAEVVNGYARSGRLAPFSVLRRQGSRRHLLELSISGTFPSRDRAYLSYASVPNDAALDTESAFNGRWQWKVTNIDQWQDDTRPWGEEPSGQLLLAVTGKRISGVVQYVTSNSDHINLPLEGIVRGDEAEWTSVSPLGLTRSEVRLGGMFGRPVLSGRAWSNRNGKAREWTWEAIYEKQID